MLDVTPILYGDNYNYLIEAPGVLGVVDLANGYDLAQRLQAQGKTPTHLFLTHHHHDHVAGLGAFVEAFAGLTVVKPKGEARIDARAVELGPGEELAFGPLQVSALVSAAHTAHHAAYLFEGGHCFTGDALFLAGCGRLFEGGPEDLRGAMAAFSALPDETRLYYGHEYGLANLRFARSVEPDNEAIETTRAELQAALDENQPGAPGRMARERRINPFLRFNEPELARRIDPDGSLSPTERLMSLRRMKDSF